jgi:hypothetical protein
MLQKIEDAINEGKVSLTGTIKNYIQNDPNKVELPNLPGSASGDATV